jgi:peroxiredoxin/outer membrane lipoprotein-sorting protein
MIPSVLLSMALFPQDKIDSAPIIAKMHERIKSLNSLQFKIKVTTKDRDGTRREEAEAVLMKPHFYSYKGSLWEHYGDDKNFYWLNHKDKLRQTISREDGIHMPQELIAFEGFIFDGEYTFLDVQEWATREVFEGKQRYKIEFKPYEDSTNDQALYVDVESFLPVGFTAKSPDDYEFTVVRTDFKINPKVEKSVFTPISFSADYREQPGLEKPLLTPGSLAPKVEAKNLRGESVRLADFATRKEAVILNFWFVDCAPCMIELPELQEMAPLFESKGIKLITINTLDKAERVERTMKKRSFTFPVLLDVESRALSNAFNIYACPTTYVIDRDGRIVGGVVGYDMKAINDLISRVAPIK